MIRPAVTGQPLEDVFIRGNRSQIVNERMYQPKDQDVCGL